MAELEQRELVSIVNSIKRYNGIDFSEYANSSLKRRINRFFDVSRIFDVDEFNLRIKNDTAFADHFIDEITVNVTEMFRDPTFWSYIRDKVIPELAQRNTIKIWHAACSTGEEVYSMAILLKESGIFDKVRITATDLNTTAIQHASIGKYSLKNQVVNNKNYRSFKGSKALSDYYKTEDKHVFYDPELLKNVTFLKHNLADESPFSTFDLIICRNVLIYFNNNLQEKVLQLFLNSLSSNSFLGIGSKESIAWTKSEKLFKTECFEEKIFRKL